jgi:hypothetical protein
MDGHGFSFDAYGPMVAGRRRIGMLVDYRSFAPEYQQLETSNEAPDSICDPAFKPPLWMLCN